MLEVVQKRAVRAVTNLNSRTYEEWLRELGLDSLEDRRKRGDLIQAYKVFNGHDKVDPATWFTRSIPVEGALATRKQRGFWSVDVPECNGDVRRNFWSVRVCDPWNALPDNIRMVETTNGFKNLLDERQGWGRQQQRH